MHFLAVRHLLREGAGTLEQYLISRGDTLDYWDIARDPSVPDGADQYDAVIVLGGPMGVYEEDLYPFLRSEIEWLREILRSRKPVLGICLGAQLLAAALNARVTRGPRKEIGWHEVRLTGEGVKDPLFRCFRDEVKGRDPVCVPVFQWHGDTFELPLGALRLAQSPLYENQAFRYDNYVYALQFHVEMTEEMIREWIREGREELVAADYVDSGAILTQIPACLNPMRKRAFLFYEAFVNMAQQVREMNR